MQLIVKTRNIFLILLNKLSVESISLADTELNVGLSKTWNTSTAILEVKMMVDTFKATIGK